MNNNYFVHCRTGSLETPSPTDKTGR